jgi:hypothetical protein
MSQHGRSEPFDLQVSRGQIPYHQVVNIYGYQINVATTYIPIWENNTTYNYPASAIPMLMTGTGSDTAKVQINGLDINYNSISEIVTLNGSTGVATTNNYFRVNSLVVVSGNPAANVTLTSSDGNTSNTYAKIVTGVGKSQNSWYTVPANSSFYLTRVQIFSSGPAVSVTTYNSYQVLTISSTGVQQILTRRPFTGNFEIRRVAPTFYAPGTDIQWQANTNTGNSTIGLSIEGYLIKNEATSSGN